MGQHSLRGYSSYYKLTNSSDSSPDGLASSKARYRQLPSFAIVQIRHESICCWNSRRCTDALDSPKDEECYYRGVYSGSQGCKYGKADKSRYIDLPVAKDIA
jgi:hypothetical protein